MAGKRAKRERRSRGPAPRPSPQPETDVFETEPPPTRRSLGLGAVIAFGAAVAATLAGGLYFFADSDERTRGDAPAEKTLSSEKASITDSLPAHSTDAAQAPVAPIVESPGDARPTSYLDPPVPVTPVAPASPQDSPAGASSGMTGLPADLAERIQILRQQVQLRPNDGVNRATLAAILEARGDLDDAEEHYRRAVKDAPNYARGRHDYGIFLAQRRKRLDEARRHLRAAVDLEPNSAQIRVGLGFVHGESGDMTSAMEQFNRALELDPSHIEAHFYLASALDEVGRLDESVERYRTVSRLQPGYYAAHYGLGAVLAKQGDFDGALEQFRLTTISPSPELRRLAEQAIGYLEEEKQEMEEQGADPPGGLPPDLPFDVPATPPTSE